MSRLPPSVQNGQFGPANPAGRSRALPLPVVLLRGPAQGLEHTPHRQQNDLQKRVASAVEVSKANPLADCSFLQNVTFTSGTPVTLRHNLGRAFVSAFLSGQSAAGGYAVQRPSAPTRPPSNQNFLDETVVVITPAFSGIADVVVF